MIYQRVISNPNTTAFHVELIEFIFYIASSNTDPCLAMPETPFSCLVRYKNHECLIWYTLKYKENNRYQNTKQHKTTQNKKTKQGHP
jgi:hypothetical protein